MKKSEIVPFFTDLEPWRKEWQGMPEFVQEDLTAVQQIIVNFVTHEDVQDFAKLVDQKITHKTKFIRFPKTTNENLLKYLYIDEP